MLGQDGWWVKGSFEKLRQGEQRGEDLEAVGKNPVQQTVV